MRRVPTSDPQLNDLSQMVENLSLSSVGMLDSPDIIETATATLGGVGQDARIYLDFF